MAAGVVREVTGNFYDVLGVGPDASPDELRAAYHRRLREHHPDSVKRSERATTRGPRDDTEELRLVVEAYAVLRDATRRAAYDRTLNRNRTSQRTPAVRRLDLLRAVGPVRWHPPDR